MFVDITHHYINSILFDDYYSRFHGLSDQRRSQQLTSILYSAGRLHQHDHYRLPSWVPDWTYAWYQAPLWCKTESNIVTNSGRDEWSAGIRCDYRAGGDKLETFEFIDGGRGSHQLRLSALLFDAVTQINEITPVRKPVTTGDTSPSSPTGLSVTLDSPTFSYGRGFFTTLRGTSGMATQGIRTGDVLAILLGGDVPVVLRRATSSDTSEMYELLCECFVHSAEVMGGDLVRTDWGLAKDIVLI